MIKHTWVWSGSRPSNGAMELAALPGFLRLRPERLFKVKPGDTVVNWGSSEPLELAATVLNTPANIKFASDKLQSFQMLRVGSVPTVEWTPSQEVAQEWCAISTVVVRNKLTGHSGDGIVIIEKLGEVPKAPLYTRYVFKEREFRVHVCMGQVIDTAQKIKDPAREVITWKVRSHANGFIFARNNLEPSAVRDAVAVAAIQALGLDFGAVDIIEDKKHNFYVLEVNTAPGLEGQTVNSYASAFNGG